jgi:hypothetical protein
VETFYSQDRVKVLERMVGRRKLATPILADVIKFSNLPFEEIKIETGSGNAYILGYLKRARF